MINNFKGNYNGLNIASHFSAMFGLREAVKSTVKIIKTIETIDTHFLLINLPHYTKISDAHYTGFSNDSSYLINVIHANPDRLTCNNFSINK